MLQEGNNQVEENNFFDMNWVDSAVCTRMKNT